MQRPKASSSIQIDNNKVRITEYSFAPGAETEFHEHLWDYIVVPQTDGELLLIDENGDQKTSKLEKGNSYFRQAGVKHNVVNKGRSELVFVEVELKA